MILNKPEWALTYNTADKGIFPELGINYGRTVFLTNYSTGYPKASF
jgi:hypothetical protein